MTITDLSPETVELLLQYCYGCLHKMPIDHAEVGLFPFSDLCTILTLFPCCSAWTLTSVALLCNYWITPGSKVVSVLSFWTFLVRNMDLKEKSVAAGD